MKRLIVVIALFGGAALLWAGPAGAQQDQRVLGEVVQGNTTIVFEAADNSDLKTRMAELGVWQEFADQHPEIASELGRNPKRIRSEGWIARHPELQQFFSQHPEIRDGMMADPGNFVAPRVPGSLAENETAGEQ